CVLCSLLSYSPPRAPRPLHFSLHDALPICAGRSFTENLQAAGESPLSQDLEGPQQYIDAFALEQVPGVEDPRRPYFGHGGTGSSDRKSTRLNSSHLVISYAVFCLKKKTTLA